METVCLCQTEQGYGTRDEAKTETETEPLTAEVDGAYRDSLPK